MTPNPDPSLALAGGPDTHVAPLLPATAPAPEPARKINFLKALLLHWLVSRRYGPHLAAGSWKRAIGAHVLSLLLFGAAFLPAYTELRPSHDLRETAAEMVMSMAMRTARNSVNWIPVLLVLLSIPLAELAFVLLAILIMPWYAGGDRAGSVFKRTLKSVYWSTTILIPIAVPIFLLATYQPDLHKWLNRHGDLLAAAVILLGFGLPIVLLARMLLAGGTRYVGPGNGPAFSPREPRCDDCGYLIVGLPLETRCPECGLQVRASLPGGRRRPTVWQENELKPRGFADLLRLQWAVFARRDFFKQLPVQSGLPAARHFWWGTWLLMLLATLAALNVLAHLPLGEEAPPDMLLSGAVGALLVPLVLQSFMMFAACLHGQLRHGIRDYRNSAVACYYASPLMWPMPALMTVAMLSSWAPVRSWLDDIGLMQLAGFWGMSGSDVLHILLLMVFLARLLFWWLRLCRALRDIQHANV